MSKPDRCVKILWERSSEGYTFSKCGQYSIGALWCGTARPHGYSVYCRAVGCKKEIGGGVGSTVIESKREAQEHHDRCHQ